MLCVQPICGFSRFAFYIQANSVFEVIINIQDLLTIRNPWGSDGKESSCNAEDPVWSLGQEDPLEKEIATHSSILAWEIPWEEEPGRLQSIGSQKSWTQLSN